MSASLKTPLKMRMTADAITDLETLGEALGVPSAALAARQLILARLSGQVINLDLLPTDRGRVTDKPEPMGQIVMRVDDEAIAKLNVIAAERHLESPALAARALLIDAMAGQGLTTRPINPIDRTRRETEKLSDVQAEAYRQIVTRMAILLDQLEGLARKWKDQPLLDRVMASRGVLSDASAALRLREPDPDQAKAMRETGYSLNTIARSLHAGDPLSRMRDRLMSLLDQLDTQAKALV